MKTALALTALLLAGCATTCPPPRVEERVVTKTEYVVRRADAAQRAVPPMPAKIDPKTATQSDLAAWIAASEERMARLERLLAGLVEFYERPVEAPKP